MEITLKGTKRFYIKAETEAAARIAATSLFDAWVRNWFNVDGAKLVNSRGIEQRPAEQTQPGLWRVTYTLNLEDEI